MGSPLSNICRDFSREAWLEYKDIAYLKHDTVQVRRGRAQHIDASKRTATYLDPSSAVHTISYDILVLAHGTHKSWPSVPIALTKAQYLDNGDSSVTLLEAAQSVAVVGGGKT
jgi:NADH dehydrogenase FAD-containing subunit